MERLIALLTKKTGSILAVFGETMIWVFLVVILLFLLITLLGSRVERRRKWEEEHVFVPWYAHSSLFGALGLGLLAVTLLVTELAIHLDEAISSPKPFIPTGPAWFAPFFRLMVVLNGGCYAAALISTIYFSLWFQYRLTDWHRWRRERRRPRRRR